MGHYIDSFLSSIIHFFQRGLPVTYFGMQPQMFIPIAPYDDQANSHAQISNALTVYPVEPEAQIAPSSTALALIFEDPTVSADMLTSVNWGMIGMGVTFFATAYVLFNYLKGLKAASDARQQSLLDGLSQARQDIVNLKSQSAADTKKITSLEGKQTKLIAELKTKDVTNAGLIKSLLEGLTTMLGQELSEAEPTISTDHLKSALSALKERFANIAVFMKDFDATLKSQLAPLSSRLAVLEKSEFVTQVSLKTALEPYASLEIVTKLKQLLSGYASSLKDLEALKEPALERLLALEGEESITPENLAAAVTSLEEKIKSATQPLASKNLVDARFEALTKSKLVTSEALGATVASATMELVKTGVFEKKISELSSMFEKLSEDLAAIGKPAKSVQMLNVPEGNVTDSNASANKHVISKLKNAIKALVKFDQEITNFINSNFDGKFQSSVNLGGSSAPGTPRALFFQVGSRVPGTPRGRSASNASSASSTSGDSGGEGGLGQFSIRSINGAKHG